MAERVKQTDILNSVIVSLQSAFPKDDGYIIYSKEVVDAYDVPCFFVTISTSVTTQAKNWMEKEVSVEILYIPEEEDKDERHYLGVIDKIQDIFQIGVKVGDRYLHVDSIEDDRMGEEQDLLLITITIPFIERVNRPKAEHELMGEVSMEVNNTTRKDAPDAETFYGNIDSDTI